MLSRNTGTEGVWSPLPLALPRVTRLAAFAADQFDLRSDEDQLYVVERVLEAGYQNVSGTRYSLRVRLAETACPKYKQTIHKGRCMKAAGGDILDCSVRLFEPASGAQEVTSMSCHDPHDPSSHEDLSLPAVHPSSHARPKFLNKFNKKTFRHRFDHSVESAESDERFYNPRTRGQHRWRSDESHSNEDDSLEFLTRSLREKVPRLRG